MKDKRIVNFYYFRPHLFDGKGKKEPFNFAEWITGFEKENNILKTIELHDFLARVDGHKYDTKHDLHGVCFVKMRDDNFPSKVAEGRAQEDLDLEDDEYIGEDMYILYDRNKNIFMMQINRMSLTIARITEFINKTREEDGKKVGFVPVTKIVSRKDLAKSKIRTIEVSCEGMYDKDSLKSSPLKTIIDGLSKIGCLSYRIKLGVGRHRNAELSPQESQNIIDDIINRSVNVSTAKVSMHNDITGEIECIDLLQNKIYSSIEFKIKGKKRLNLDIVFDKMKNEFMRQNFIQINGKGD